jgi:ABC-type branched-subunit amino acid transport system ATPase component/ABC-type branched-subunit amino acid transport system permease subunit
MVDHHLSFWLAALAGMASAAAVGALMALPAFRISTWYFALITLAFAQVTGNILIEWRGLTKGYAGIIGIPMPELAGMRFGGRELYWAVALAVIAVFVLLRNLVLSRFGRALVAVRDNPSAAVASGASVVRLKMFAFVVSAALAGLAGAFYAVQKSVITPDDFTSDFSIFFLLMVVLGGSGRLWGPVLGTVVFFLVPELLSSLQSWRLLIYGVALLVLMLFAPRGLVGMFEQAWYSLRGRRPQDAPPPPAAAAPAIRQPAAGLPLAIKSVQKHFGGVAALADVSIAIKAGESHAIVGPNGSGKTTLLNLISGFYLADGGSITLGERNVVGLAPHAIARLGVGRTFQTPKLLGELSVIDNIMLGAFASEAATAAEIGLRLARARREAADVFASAMAYLDFVGLSDHAFAAAGAIPHGQQRLVEIARALVGNPKLLLLDEPAAGLSLHELDQLGRLIAAIRDRGTTVVVVEHHLELIASICSEITVLNRGSVLAAGSPQAVFSNSAVLEAYMGSRAVHVGNPS